MSDSKGKLYMSNVVLDHWFKDINKCIQSHLFSAFKNCTNLFNFVMYVLINMAAFK